MDRELIDRAWRILPAEFKRVVKAHYAGLNAAYKAYLSKDSLTNDECDRCKEIREKIVLYNMYFGIHNITSDAKGEDEMLYAEKSKVQKIFAGQTEVQKSTPCGTILHHEAAAKTELLYALFGSKCLPDNVESSEPNVDSLHDNVDSLPQNPTENCDNKSHISADCNKPSEPKFTKGDMVHCKSFGYEGDYKVLEYTGGPRNCYDCIDKYGAYYRFYESDLEPYTEPKEESPQMKSIESKVSVYLATKEEDEEFRLLLHENGFKWNGDSLLIDSSCWDPDIQDSKIHFVYPDMTVTHGGNKTLDTLTFSEFKKRYFGENVNHRQFIANCDKQFDNILKDSLSKERRLNIATNVLEALIKSQYYSLSPDCQEENISEMAEVSVRLADALIAEVQSSTESLCSAKKGGRS